MCTGLEIAAIASLGAAAGGSVMQYNAAQDAQKASARASMSELARQKQYREEAEKIFAASANRNQQSATAQDEALLRQKREADYARPVERGPAVGYAPSTPGAPEVIKGEFARADEGAKRYGMQQGKARAALDGFGDANLLQRIFMARQMGKLRNLGDFSAGSQGALESELTAAKAKGRSGLGDLLVALGKAGIQASAGGFGGGAPTNIVPSAMGPPLPTPPGVPFVPAYFAPSNFPALY